MDKTVVNQFHDGIIIYIAFEIIKNPGKKDKKKQITASIFAVRGSYTILTPFFLNSTLETFLQI